MLNTHKLKLLRSRIPDILPALFHACLLLLHPDWAGEHLQDTSQQKFWVFDDMISMDVSELDGNACFIIGSVCKQFGLC